MARAIIIGMPRKRLDSHTWDTAIRAVQNEMLDLAAAVTLSDEQDRILGTVFHRCESLRAKHVHTVAPTNRELAGKYGVSLRTVTNWRREGCPFDSGQWRVLDWIAKRRYAPAGTREKFAKGLRQRKTRAIFEGGLAAFRAEILELKARHLAHGVPMDDWLRRMPFRAR